MIDNLLSSISDVGSSCCPLSAGKTVPSAPAMESVSITFSFSWADDSTEIAVHVGWLSAGTALPELPMSVFWNYRQRATTLKPQRSRPTISFKYSEKLVCSQVVFIDNLGTEQLVKCRGTLSFTIQCHGLPKTEVINLKTTNNRGLNYQFYQKKLKGRTKKIGTYPKQEAKSWMRWQPLKFNILMRFA